MAKGVCSVAMIKILLISAFLSSGCQKQLPKEGNHTGFSQVKFWTDYNFLSGTKIFIKDWQSANYDSAFTKLIYRNEAPYCDDTAFQVFKAAKGRFYAVHYTDTDGNLEVDTAIFVPEYNQDKCVWINLNN